ncbi:hypothetical protein ACFVUQ_05760 [Streptomyces cyaneofuscatus]|uniref:hypothetical protein n=1 Tax=Streptomyces cyaneofuscatus TaxID=66883 RepID=UPI0036D8F681
MISGGAWRLVTATSADSRCGGWVVGGVVGRVEGIAEDVDGLALESDVGADADVGVVEEFLDDDEVDT